MKTIIAGSRTAVVYHDLLNAIGNCGWNPSAVVSGTARGADRLGEYWAKQHDVPLHRYPAQWDVHGKSAGYKRNELMAQNADALIALWDGQSRGTRHMIDIAKRNGLKVYIHMI